MGLVGPCNDLAWIYVMLKTLNINSKAHREWYRKFRQHIQLFSLSIRPKSVDNPYLGSSRTENMKKVYVKKKKILI